MTRSSLVIRSRRWSLSAGAVLVAAGLLIGACGDDDGTEEEGSAATGGAGEETTEAGGPTLSVSALDNFYRPKQLRVPAGEEVTIELTNDGNTVHTFTVPALDVDTGDVGSGDSETVTLTVSKDTEFVCTIHDESDNMVGKLVVE